MGHKDKIGAWRTFVKYNRETVAEKKYLPQRGVLGKNSSGGDVKTAC
jgi:hypothetical protein